MHALLDSLSLLYTTLIVPIALLGLTWGVIGGALPGISPSITMALLLPLTYSLDPTAAIVLLAATYIGAEYGGSIPAILIRTPGTNSAAATVIDGYEMTKQGKAGEALGISLWSGIVGGLVGLAMLVLLTEPLSRLALAFTPMSYFGLGMLGLSVIASLTGGSPLKGFAAAIIGMMVATVGTDPISGVTRLTFDSADLLSGIEPILVMVGLFAISELMSQSGSALTTSVAVQSVRIRLPSLRMMRRLARAQAIGSGIGTFEGVTPGAGGTIAAFLSYNEARRWSKHPEEFGKGSPEGIAAPETANNTVASTSLIPLLGFGIPGSNSAAVLLGGFLLHGLVPGPTLFQDSAAVVQGLYVGSFVATVGQLLVGFILMPLCLWLITRPRPYLAAFILALVLSGVYSLNVSLFDLGIVLVAGLTGYVMRIFGFPFLPAVLGVVLCPLVESSYRRSLVLAGGDHSIFAEDRICLGLLAAAALFLVFAAWRELRSSAKETGAAS
jgi:putative tricarboxylic transport membrane protein